jgi:RNA-directed DNA polymerase
MQTILQGIARKAGELKKYRFRNLYGLINQETLKTAWSKLNKQSATGIDRITVKAFEENFDSNIAEIVQVLKEKRYKAKMVRRVYIPKGKGKLRPLGILVIADKLIQIVASEILTAIYEQDFYPNSYGYRPGLGPHDAIIDLSKELQFGPYNYIVEADIKGFFDNMNHDWIVKMLEQRVDDKAFIRLIKKWLKAGILEEDGKTIHPVKGTPQGGIISPVIANMYLHYVLDHWFEKVAKPGSKGKVYLCRYADDFVCAFQYKEDAERFYGTLGERLGKFNLEISEEKTNLLRFSRYQKTYNTSFEFLGFEFRWGRARNGKRIIKRRTAPKRLQKSIRNFTEWCRTILSMRLREIFEKLNTKLVGYYNYYGLIGNFESLKRFFYRMTKILFKWLKRKSHKRRLNWGKLNKYFQIYRIEYPRITQKLNRQANLEFKSA